MSDQIQQKLSDSRSMRWTALILLAGAMFFAYIFVDILSPLQGLLQTQRGWDPVAYGHYAGSEPFLNVFVFFLIFAGIILDKMGVRFTAVLSGIVMVIGAGLNWFAVTDTFEASSLKIFMDSILNLPDVWWNITPWYDGMPASAKLAAIGFMVFGCGTEMAGITVSRGIVKWFTGHELALAISVSRPVAAGLLLVCIALISFIAYGFMDKKLDAQGATEEKDDPFKVSDIGKILSSKMFWVVALLCVLYYSAIFPFQKYAINMLQCNLDFTDKQAGYVFFVFPLGAAAITPLLGNYLDRKGKGASMLILGAILMIACHLVFAFVVPATQSVVITLAAIVILGISFSLVPAALWPSVPKLIDQKLLGSAYALIFWIQNIGLYAFPMIIGSVLKATNPNITNPLEYNYTVPMVVFASLGVLALLLGFYLKAIDKKGGYGLEEPNIKS